MTRRVGLAVLTSFVYATISLGNASFAADSNSDYWNHEPPHSLAGWVKWATGTNAPPASPNQPPASGSRPTTAEAAHAVPAVSAPQRQVAGARRPRFGKHERRPVAVASNKTSPRRAMKLAAVSRDVHPKAASLPAPHVASLPAPHLASLPSLHLEGPIVRVSADAAELPSVDALQPLMRGAGIEVRSWLRSSPAEDDTTRADLEIAPLIGEAPQNEKSAFMARLFTEELHVLARSDIKTLSDLRGRRVSLGVVGSPERNAAVKIFDAEHVDVVETPLDLDNAIDALSLNAIDAVAIIAPKPFARLQDIKDADFHLLAVPPPSHMEGLWPSAFDHADYPALVDARIDAVALNAGLFNKAPVDHGKSAATKQFFAALVSHGAQLASLSPTWSEVKIQDGGRRADGQAGSQK